MGGLGWAYIMKFNKIQVLTVMSETGIIPVFYHKDGEVAKNVLKACYEGGIRAFEFTNRGDFAQEVFAGLVKFASVQSLMHRLQPCIYSWEPILWLVRSSIPM